MMPPAAFLTVAVIVPSEPATVRLIVVGLTVIVAGVVSVLTVTAHVAVWLFAVAAVTVVLPAARACTTPAALTVATPGAELVHVKGAPGRVAPSAFRTVAVMVWSAPPMISVIVVGETVIEAGVTSGDTVTEVVSVIPLEVVAVSTPLPAATVCTTPELDPTVKIVVSLDVYVTAALPRTRPAAFVTTDVTFVSAPPTARESVSGDITTVAGVVSALTVTVAVAVWLFDVEAVIVTVGDTPFAYRLSNVQAVFVSEKNCVSKNPTVADAPNAAISVLVSWYGTPTCTPLMKHRTTLLASIVAEPVHAAAPVVGRPLTAFIRVVEVAATREIRTMSLAEL